MYGVPADLNLTRFEGAYLEQIALGPYIVHFHFGADLSPVISVEGRWELSDSSGRVVDRQIELAEREAYRLHVLFERAVVATELHAPGWFELVFEGGYTLRIFDDSPQYESFHIQPGELHV